MNELEIAVRSIEEILPRLSTTKIQKWKAILETAALKCEVELSSTDMNTCDVCQFQEYGYRTELPTGWRGRGDLTICFNHEDAEVAKLLSEAVEADKERSEVIVEESLNELMDLI